MQNTEKLTRNEVLRELDVTEDTLSVYEHELEMDIDPTSGGIGSFTQEELKSLRLLHKLRESGLTYSEIKLLTSFAEILKNVDIEEKEELKSLLSLSPIYKLRQSLILTRQELASLREKAKELEEALNKEIKARENIAQGDISVLQTELDAKQKALNNLDRKLSETLQLKSQLETDLQIYRQGKTPITQIKGKKAKELHETISKKDLELEGLKKKNEELTTELEKSKEETLELMEQLDYIENEVQENEQEIEERYKIQINSLKAQIEDLVDKKQKEWEKYCTQSNEQHKIELLVLQRKHEREILKLKQKIKTQMGEIEELRAIKNPLLGLLNVVRQR